MYTDINHFYCYTTTTRNVLRIYVRLRLPPHQNWRSLNHISTSRKLWKSKRWRLADCNIIFAVYLFVAVIGRLSGGTAANSAATVWFFKVAVDSPQVSTAGGFANSPGWRWGRGRPVAVGRRACRRRCPSSIRPTSTRTLPAASIQSPSNLSSPSRTRMDSGASLTFSGLSSACGLQIYPSQPSKMKPTFYVRSRLGITSLLPVRNRPYFIVNSDQLIEEYEQLQFKNIKSAIKQSVLGIRKTKVALTEKNCTKNTERERGRERQRDVTVAMNDREI